MLDRIKGDWDRAKEPSPDQEFIEAFTKAMEELYSYPVEAVEFPFQEGEDQVIEFHSSPNKHLRPADIFILNSLLDKHVLPELQERGFNSFWVHAPLDVYGTIRETVGISIIDREAP